MFLYTMYTYTYSYKCIYDYIIIWIYCIHFYLNETFSLVYIFIKV